MLLKVFSVYLRVQQIQTKVKLAYFHFIIDTYLDYVLPSNTEVLPLKLGFF